MHVLKRLHVELTFISIVLIAASNYVVCKLALESVSIFTLVAFRYLFAVALISCLFFKQLKGLSPEFWLNSIPLGFLLTVAVITWLLGIDRTDHLGPSAFIVSTDGLLVPVLGLFVFGETIGKMVWVALPLAFAGVALLTLKSGMSATLYDLWFVLSAFCFAFHILLTSRVARRFNSIVLAWAQLLVVGTVTLPIAIVADHGQLAVANILKVKYELLYLAVIATALRFSLQNYAQKRTSAVRAGFLFALEPIAVSGMGWVFLGQSMSFQQGTGCILIFTALILSRLRARRSCCEAAY